MGDFFFGPWFNPPEEGETEEERRRRLEAAQLDVPVEPEVPPEVQDLATMDQGIPEQRVITAPRFIGTESPASNVLSQYEDWLSSQPSREEHQAGTGRKILAVLAGFLAGLKGGPETAMRITRGIVDDPYNRAVSDWKERGSALGDVGKLAQDVSETGRKRESDIMSFMTAEERVAAANAAIKQREAAEGTRHADRMSSIKNESERAAEVKRHNQEMEKIASARNAIDKSLAASRATTAGAYAQRVKDLGEGKGKSQKVGSYADMNEALQDSLQEMQAKYPDFNKYFDYKESPSSGLKTFIPKSGLAPADQIRMEGMLKDAQASARKKLEGLWEPGFEDVEDIPGMRSEVP